MSGFGRRGHRCAHILSYWQFGASRGIGAGAHGKLSFPDRIVRQVRWREPAMYMDKALAGQALSNEAAVAIRELPVEYMMNALRLAEGFELSRFAERTGQSVAVIDAALQRARAQGLIEIDGVQVRPTPRGFDFLSDLQALFL